MPRGKVDLDKLHPLVRAVTLLQRATRKKAHPRIIQRLEDEVKRQAKETNERFGGFQNIEAIANGFGLSPEGKKHDFS